ncbi:MAG TPA: uroporphyrinogen-III synthase [Bacteroidota bacterium]|nr:uroporphyrinogen-III synthase [Bacteroidota bacterium]
MQPLAGKTVLITRAEGDADEFTKMLQALGARTVHLPAIAIADPDSWEPVDNAIDGLEKYDGVFFTSRNAVLKFVRRLEAKGAKSILLQKQLYAVGEKTEEALEEQGLTVAATPEVYSAEALAESFAERNVEGKRFLFPRSNIGKDIVPTYLREMGAIVHEIVVYKTVSPTQKDLDAVRNPLHHGEIDIATFFSPSAVRNFIQMMGKNSLQQTVIAVIGPATASATAEVGLKATIIAKQATSESLVEAIRGYFGN